MKLLRNLLWMLLLLVLFVISTGPFFYLLTRP